MASQLFGGPPNVRTSSLLDARLARCGRDRRWGVRPRGGCRPRRRCARWGPSRGCGPGGGGGAALAAAAAQAGVAPAGAQAGVAARPGNVTIYLAPASQGGKDSNTGLTSSSPILTLAHAQQVLRGLNPTGNVTIRIKQGTYVASAITWSFYVPGHTISFMP